MGKFHLNSNTGNPGACRAKEGNCPFGSSAPHYDTKELALAAYEKEQAGSFNKEPLSYVKNILKTLPQEDYSTWELEDAEDNWGDSMEYQPGILNEDSFWLYRNGQCLSLAKELASAFGTNKIAVHHQTLQSEELAWDDEKDEPLLDEDGEEYFETYESIHHAYAVAPDGSYWDVDGRHEPSSIITYPNEGVSEYSSEEAYENYSGYMSDQNHDLAQSFVRVILEKELGKTNG